MTCWHVILATSSVSCACIVAICTKTNKALAKSSRSFPVTYSALMVQQFTAIIASGCCEVIALDQNKGSGHFQLRKGVNRSTWGEPLLTFHGIPLRAIHKIFSLARFWRGA